MSDQQQPIEVRRFDFVVAGVGDPEDGRNLRKASTEESEHGGWVPFEDHERATTNLKQRIEELEERLAKLSAGLDQCEADQCRAHERTIAAEQTLEEARGQVSRLVESDGTGLRHSLNMNYTPAAIVGALLKVIQLLETPDQGDTEVRVKEEVEGDEEAYSVAALMQATRALDKLVKGLTEEVERLRERARYAEIRWADESRRGEVRCSARGEQLTATETADRLQALLDSIRGSGGGDGGG